MNENSRSEFYTVYPLTCAGAAASCIT